MLHAIMIHSRLHDVPCYFHDQYHTCGGEPHITTGGIHSCKRILSVCVGESVLDCSELLVIMYKNT